MKIIANLHALLRCVLVCVHILIGIVMVFIYRLRFGKHWYLSPSGLSAKRWWMLNMNSLLGIRVAQYGQIDRQPFVAIQTNSHF